VLRKAVVADGLVPCLLGSALKNCGVPTLLSAVVDYLPSPAERGAVPGRDPRTSEEISFDPDPDAPLGAVVFKTVHFSTGDLTFVRLYSGSFGVGDALFNPRLRRTERVGRLFLMHAAAREPIERATCGQIVACMGLKESVTGDTLCAKEAPIAREDPTFRTFTDQETSETIIAGMGELHLEVIAHRIRDDFRIRVNTGKPRVAYRQSFSRAATIDARHIKQTGGAGQYAVARIEFEPMEGEEVEVVDEITGGRITKEFLAALEKGIRDHFQGGGKLGAQIQGVRATIVDGKMHDVDSSQIAFYACGGLAARMAEEQCKPLLLEPFMHVEVSVPEDYLGAVLGDINARRGLVQELVDEGHAKLIRARVPLGELAAYSTTLRSITSGRGTYSMEPDGYEVLPAGLVEKLEKEGLLGKKGQKKA
jgi:elongation factor G